MILFSLLMFCFDCGFVVFIDNVSEVWKKTSWCTFFVYILLVNVTYFFSPFSSRAHSPMIAVGSDDNSPNILAKVQIYEYNENTR